MKILVINGPNMDMLGKRNPALYGDMTLKQLSKKVSDFAKKKGVKTVFFQSACEGKIVWMINRFPCDGILLNAAAYSHTSIAIRDAIECCGKKVVEVHLSDITAREDFRKVRMFDGVVAACFYGKGLNSYLEGIDFLATEVGA